MGKVRLKRIQRKRTKGFRLPDNTLYIGRPSVWANPYILKKEGSYWKVYPDYDPSRVLMKSKSEDRARDYAVHRFKQMFLCLPDFVHRLNALSKYEYLACWCPEDKPCHGDVLIELYNKYIDKPASDKPTGWSGVDVDQFIYELRYGEDE